MGPIGLAFLALIVASFCRLVVKFRANKRSMLKLQSLGLPMPAFDPIAGHLKAIGKAMRNLPADATSHNRFWQLSKTFDHRGVFYVNVWPYNRTILVVATPDAAAQVESYHFSKGEDLIVPLEKITGGPSILTLNGTAWKSCRGMFNPGFNPGYMIGLAPVIAEEVVVFCNILRGHARSHELFQLEDLTMKLTIDMIGAVVLNTRLGHQTSQNPIAVSLRNVVEWTNYGTTFNPFRRYLSLRPIVIWWNSRRIDKLIATAIDARVKKHMDDLEDTQEGPGTQRSRSILALLMDQSLETSEGKDRRTAIAAVKKLLIPQLRLFLFAGHDTTSATILYCIHNLCSHLDGLKNLMQEHDEVFGKDISQVHSIIREDPHRLNKLPYTLAVIKETLRLFPPAASMKRGRAGCEVVDEEGRRFPTEECNVWTLNLLMHHNPKFWPEPESFLPERWLVGSDDPLYPTRGAWRPFEGGQRNCIGQTLALLELKIALVMMVREIKITPAYEEWDNLHPRKGLKTVNGNRVYQAERGGGGAHPSGDFPVRVSLRERN